MMKSPINSTKHYFQISLATVANGVIANFQPIDAVEQTLANLSQEVRAGAVVKAVFIELWIRATAAEGAVLVSLYKTEGGAGPMNFGNQTALHSYENKKNIFYHTQGLSNDNANAAIPFMRQWFKIPKGKQRFGLGDGLRISISAQVAGQTVCGFVTYKEYY